MPWKTNSRLDLGVVSFSPVFADKKVRVICVLCFNQFVVYSMRNPVDLPDRENSCVLPTI